MGLRKFSTNWLLMIVVVVTSCSIGSTAAQNDTDNDDGWESYKMQFNKNYGSTATDLARRTNRQWTLALIEKHNEDAARTNCSFFLRENTLSDMTDEEYANLLGYRSDKMATTSRATRRRRSSRGMSVYYNTVNATSLPSCVDWSAKSWVGPVLYQGYCSSCWSYTAVGSLQAQLYNVTRQFVQLSPQNLIDCSFPQGNGGCKGGNMQKAFNYIASNGIMSLSDYPDTSKNTGKNGSCRYNTSLSVTTIESYRNVDDGNELALQQAVALVGPVAVGVDASSRKFQSYGGGVYSDRSCGSGVGSLNHAVLVVGYGVYNNISYWLVQNSWGTRWGINGYMMLARNANNLCGIATDATFPIIGWNSTPPSTPVSGSVDCV